MALEYIWDTVQDAEVEQSLLNGSRMIRTGLVKGMSTTTVTDAKRALVDVLENAAVPLLGDPFDDDHTTSILVHRVARGIPGTKGTMARIWLHYDRPGGGGAPIETFAAEDVTTLVSEPTQLIPGTLSPMLCSLTTTPPNLSDDPQPATVKLITANYPRTYRAFVLYGLFNDRPSSSVLDAANTVNSATWQGRGRGFWRCEGPRVRYSNRDGMFAVSVGFVSRGTQPGDDWSTYEFARDAQGETVKPSDTLMNTLKGQSYAFGMQWSSQGVYKAGLYQVSNFASIFGTDFSIGD